MGSLRDYYDADFDFTLRVFRNRTLTIAGVNLEIREQIHLDDRSNAKFVSYFVPETAFPVELCQLILNHPEWGLSASDGVGLYMGHQAEEGMTPKEALVFTCL